MTMKRNVWRNNSENDRKPVKVVMKWLSQPMAKAYSKRKMAKKYSIINGVLSMTNSSSSYSAVSAINGGVMTINTNNDANAMAAVANDNDNRIII